MPAFGSVSTIFRAAAAPDAGPEIAWYAQRLLPEPGLILDAMCGWGRLLAPLLAQGCHIHGVDASAAMIAHCEAQLATVDSGTTIVRQDMTQLNIPFRYGSALLAGGAFQYLTDALAATQALERLRGHLVPPGHLFIDCDVPQDDVLRLAAPLVELRTVSLEDGTRIALRSESTFWPDARLARTENRYAHRRRAQLQAEEHETLARTWYAPDELVSLVSAAGYREVTVVQSPRATVDAAAFMIAARA